MNAERKKNPWIEAIRLRTLPVSAAGVVAASGYAWLHGGFRWLPAAICLLFALLAQTASNFANEYYDYVNGSDKKGRQGFRRGVTEGDISPKAMKRAAFALLFASCALGCCLIPFGGFKLIPIGMAIALFAVAYSAGPYPLSRVGLGDAAVLVFFGIVAVCLTFYLQTGYLLADVVCASVALGLMSDNVLIVNNYRDCDDDRQSGKKTTVVRFGRKTALWAYLVFGLAGIALTAHVWTLCGWFFIAPALYLILHLIVWKKISRSSGAALNPLLGATARNMLVYVLLLLICIAAYKSFGLQPPVS